MKFSLYLLLTIFFSNAVADVKDSYITEQKYISLAEVVSGVSREAWPKENQASDLDKATWLKKDGLVIAQKGIYFVKVNKLPLAVRALKNNDAILLTESFAEYYAGHHYKKTNPEVEPYLVRAMFENLTGSDFHISWHAEEKVLSVHYSSLGPSSDKLFSPLVVNLPEKPKKVVLTFGGAL